METRTLASRGMAVTPHHLATQSAIRILMEGGTAMEAMVAAAATIAVVYPHMNSIGGDGFWLIVPPCGECVAIEACGPAGSLANHQFFEGYSKIPFKGPKSAITVAGTIGGWEEALKYVSESGYSRMSLSKLLADAITYAEDGFPVSSSQIQALQSFGFDENNSQEFRDIFLPNGTIPTEGEVFCQSDLAKTLKDLSRNGLNSFYRGELAKSIAKQMKLVGMPITESDLARYSAIRRTPLKLTHSQGELINLPPPTQGAVSLSILGMLDKLGIDGQHEGQFIHATVEATKQAFGLRDRYITDPRYMTVDAQSLLASSEITKMASQINLNEASPSEKGLGQSDTIWMGVMDSKGYSVSFIQSTYQHFGSGIVIPGTGIVWHNRGISFTLKRNHLRSLVPGKKPFHTLNPAAAILNDGRVMIYGTRGGDGQPQTQAAIFHRYVIQCLNLQKSVSDPRWVYGSTVERNLNTFLNLESRFSNETIEYLKKRGHKVVILEPFSENVGHAGALVRYPGGILEGAYDPRSNGNAVGF
ncbi:oxamate amidohydrolase proenzyme-like [Bicyclus anynana]|uniref:Oxamate amidohydrolase proenzyme-like n=1 Tax=Bicyclus anynana TaxID=110368 RepID=A0ABM3LN38_BICAN|nr:oxamate amidohydrolase proenzyme-like [Bicyclus anynana]